MTIPKGSHLSECQFCHQTRPVYKEGRRHGCQAETDFIGKYMEVTRGPVVRKAAPHHPPTDARNSFGGDKVD
jgi:hypothetical protein